MFKKENELIEKEPELAPRPVVRLKVWLTTLSSEAADRVPTLIKAIEVYLRDINFKNKRYLPIRLTEFDRQLFPSLGQAYGN